MSVLAITLCYALLAQTPSDAWPLTTPERTAFTETSTAADVSDFLAKLQARGAPFTCEVIGKTVKNQAITMVVVSDKPTTPSLARRAGKIVAYIQANIHGGEVEGKESVQILLREIAQGQHDEWLEKFVLVIVPIYNVDGNDAFGNGAQLRPSQYGPAIVGQRANADGLDLNRDCMKARSPEMRAILSAVYRRWDPDVVLDLHTTNGTRHGYPLTYSPPLDPNTVAPILSYTRDRLLPDVRASLQAKSMETFDYGNYRNGRWRTFGAEPRYVTNYAGTRSRIGILSEATSYLSLEDRIDATSRFVSEVLDTLDPAVILPLVRHADELVIGWGLDPAKAPPLGVRFEMVSRGMETVLLEDPAQRPGGGAVPPGPLKPVTAEIFDRFSATKKAAFPGAYFIPPSQSQIATLLKLHGVEVSRLTTAWTGPVDRFTISNVTVSARLFQGRRLRTLDGSFEREEATVPPGYYVVSTAQPLGVLAFSLLEPESTDGAAAWGFFDPPPTLETTYPILKSVLRFTGATVK